MSHGIKVQDLIDMYTSPMVTLSEQSKKSRISTLRNLGIPLLDTSHMVRQLHDANIGNARIAMVLKSVALWYRLQGDLERSNLYISIGSTLSQTLNQGVSHKVIPLAAFDKAIANPLLPVCIRFILSLFLDAPLRLNDFRMIHGTCETQGNYVYNGVFYVHGTKNGEKYATHNGYDTYKCSNRTLDLFRQCNHCVNMGSSHQFSDILTTWLPLCFGKEITTVNDLRHGVAPWITNARDMHHTELTHALY